MKSSNKRARLDTIAPRRLAGFALTLMCASVASAQDAATANAPPCYGPDNYATQAALTALVNSNNVADATDLYHDDTVPYGLSTTLLDAAPIGPMPGAGGEGVTVFRQVQKIQVATRDNTVFELLTISEVSSVECSLTAPTVVLMVPGYNVLSVGDSLFAPRKP
ncbi:hypothetical protein [Nitrogeniibacter aestuarii]|uniref:hypothetical protein n=1 Tax=Nitrogeniibacter aestuarii TaxID=2815343 RepID=UPI001D10BB36|nr:hypothetical protein [Nitrogeniibacter aestuarii]